MNLLFKIIMFVVMFNIAAVFIAYTNFFPNAMYNDKFGIGEDPENVPASRILFETFYKNPAGEIPSFGVLEADAKVLSFGVIMTGLILFAILVSVGTHSFTFLSLVILGYVFLAMWANNKEILYSITANMDSSISYIVLMISIGVLFLFVITLMDYASGQRMGS